MQKLLLLAVFTLAAIVASARDIRGKVRDAKTGEEIIGASITVKEAPEHGTMTGLDGSFQLSVDKSKYTLVCSYLGYKDYVIEVDDLHDEIEIHLMTNEVLLEGVTVTATNPGRTEAGARGIAAINTVKAIYDRLDIPRLTEQQISLRFERALAILDTLSVEPDRTKRMRDYAASLMGRKH